MHVDVVQGDQVRIPVFVAIGIGSEPDNLKNYFSFPITKKSVIVVGLK